LEHPGLRLPGRLHLRVARPARAGAADSGRRLALGGLPQPLRRDRRAAPRDALTIGSEAMSTALSGEPARLLARTVPIADPGDLLDLLPRADAAGTASWLRRGDGLVGWGVAARIDTSGATRMIDADAWWRATAAAMVVRDDVRVPGTGPVAFGSFAFSR